MKRTLTILILGLCKGSMGITIMLQQLSRNFSDNEIMRAFKFLA